MLPCFCEQQWLNDNILKYERLWLLYMYKRYYFLLLVINWFQPQFSNYYNSIIHLHNILLFTTIVYIFVCLSWKHHYHPFLHCIFVMLISYIFARHKYWMNDWMNWLVRPWMRKSIFPTWIIVHYPAWGNHTLGIQSYSHLNMVQRNVNWQFLCMCNVYMQTHRDHKIH